MLHFTRSLDLQGQSLARFNWGGTVPAEREALTITMINETGTLRHCWVMEVGIGSSIQRFVGDLKRVHILVFCQWAIENSKGRGLI